MKIIEDRIIELSREIFGLKYERNTLAKYWDGFTPEHQAELEAKIEELKATRHRLESAAKSRLAIFKHSKGIPSKYYPPVEENRIELIPYKAGRYTEAEGLTEELTVEEIDENFRRILYNGRRISAAQLVELLDLQEKLVEEVAP